MIYFLYFAILFLIVTSVVLVRNYYEFEGLTNVGYEERSNSPFVSICIPARNEEAVIDRCVKSALKQDYENFEVLVLDDNSTDGTTEILEQFSGIIANLKHLKGAPKPDNWLGKPWACHQLSQQAKGEILVFIDADVWLEPNAIPSTVQSLEAFDAITVWPQQKLVSFWEQMILPLIYFALLTLLPTKYVERTPRWLPGFLKSTLDPKFVAGCGQFFAFNRKTYDSIQGHEGVKMKVVEDMELARSIKNNGLSLKMYHGLDSVNCRMYTNHSDIWSGFQKNFLAGFGNLFEFIFMGFVHLVVFLLPVYTLIIGLITGQTFLTGLSVVTLSLIVLQRLLLNIIFRWSIWSAFLHPFSVLWYQALGLSCIVKKAFGVKTNWKGRQV